MLPGTPVTKGGSSSGWERKKQAGASAQNSCTSCPVPTPAHMCKPMKSFARFTNVLLGKSQNFHSLQVSILRSREDLKSLFSQSLTGVRFWRCYRASQIILCIVISLPLDMIRNCCSNSIVHHGPFFEEKIQNASTIIDANTNTLPSTIKNTNKSKMHG